MSDTPPVAANWSYFAMQASWGATKHLGGRTATDELAALMRLAPGQIVLEIGCGVGMTACHLARRYGVRVISLDLSPQMIAWARRRAQRENLSHRIDFVAADAQWPPFTQASFDAVISESVMAFVPDTPRALAEFGRVARPGAPIGLAEGTWTRPTPPADLVDYVARTMSGARFQSPAEWGALLADSGLERIETRVHTLDARRQWLSEVRDLDAADLRDRARAMRDFARLYATDASFREYATTLTPSRTMMADLFRYLGYGVYVGWTAPSGTITETTARET